MCHFDNCSLTQIPGRGSVWQNFGWLGRSLRRPGRQRFELPGLRKLSHQPPTLKLTHYQIPK